MPTKNAKPSKVPAYRLRTGYDQAIVALTDAVTKQRRDYWLGEFNSRESRERYHRVIARWEAGERRLPPPDPAASRRGAAANGPHAVTVVEIIREYWRWAEGYYRPKHAQALHGALSLLRQFYGRIPAADFGPNKLRLLREEMTRGDGTRRRPWAPTRNSTRWSPAFGISKMSSRCARSITRPTSASGPTSSWPRWACS